MTDRFVILAWHSIHVLDNTIAGNDLIAFSQALDTLDRTGWTILPLGEALDRLDGGGLPERTAVLTADDGSVMDFEAFDHPTCGRQRSLYHRLQAFAATLPADTRHVPHLSSFVIASPEARAELDRADYMSLGVWRDDWWRAANDSGLISIESHSWDHNHASLETTAQRDNRSGDFTLIDTEDECRIEVDRASDFIESSAGRRPGFFAFPYGQVSDYLRREYLPRHGPDLGLRAALACEPEPVTKTGDRWYLPRYMCGRDWRTGEELTRLLHRAAA